MKNLFSILLIITLSAGLFRGCERKGDPPVLPSPETMKIDFSDFISPSKSAYSRMNVKGIDAVESINWELASNIAGLWNTLLAAKIVVPVAAFSAADKTQPYYLGSNKWEWKYNFDVAGTSFEARLTGQIRKIDIKWEMYISNNGSGAFAEFLWFDGTTVISGKSGQWVLINNLLFQQPMLQIDWILNGTAVGNVKYTYIRESNDSGLKDTFKDSYIEYGLTTNDLNAFYNIHLNISGVQDDFKDVFVEWSTTDHNGHIKANYHYQDDLWHCWDGMGNDVDCNKKL
jgi:hypothetical protein